MYSFIRKKLGIIYRFIIPPILRFIKYIEVKVSSISLANKEFTIISDNCWGGFVYQRYGLMYRTPTIGLFFYPEDFIKFLENLDTYLSIELKFIPIEKSKYCYLSNDRKYPVGILGEGIEVQFLHYKTEKEAKEKWEIRKKRIDTENMLIKMADRSSLCSMDFIERFSRLPYKNKICFTRSKFDYDCCIYTPELEMIVDKRDSDIPITLKKIKVTKLLNNLKEIENAVN